MKKIFAFLIVFQIIFSKDFFAQRPGDLDSTFGVNGIVVTEMEEYQTAIDPYFFDGVKAIFVLNDGKILCAGTADYLKHFIAARYNEDGSIDESFGTSGFTIIENVGSLTNAKITANGKLLMAGYKDNNFVLVRLRNDGTVDSTFGDNGIVMHEVKDAGHSVFLQGLDIQNDNRILAQGSLLNDTFSSYMRYQVVVRYHEDGSVDESFADNGQLILYLLPMWYYNTTINVINDGQILSTYYKRVFKIKNDGTVDSTYGDGGHVTFNFGIGTTGFGQICSSAFASDSTIIYLSWIHDWYPFPRASLSKFNINGTIDSSFGLYGSILFDFEELGYRDQLHVVVQNDNKIITSGFTKYSVGTDYKSCFEIIRFHEDGTIDSTFGENGIVRTHISDSSQAFCSALQEDGKLLVAGVSDSGAFTIARYHTQSAPTSVLPIENTNNKLLLYPNPVSYVLFIDKIHEPILQIEIRNILGREMHLPVNDKSINVSSLPSGIYFIKILTEKGETFGKFVKE